jgi:hypothetical protein
MPIPRFEVPAGAVNGTNVIFTVSQPYQPGSTAVFNNGLLMEQTLDDGWFETSPATGVVTLKEAPSGTPAAFPDVIQVFYLDTSPALPETEVTPLFGRLREVDFLDAQIFSLTELPARIEEVAGLRGMAVPADVLAGKLLGVEAMVGRMAEVCA